MATIYTRVECNWDGVTQEYVVNEKQGFEYNGPILFAKKKFKQILGIVATIAIAAFAPQALGISQTMAGALGGAVGGAIGGGGKGAILGAITGGIGGYGVENGWWGGAGASGLEGSSSAGSTIGSSPLAGTENIAASVGTGGELGFNNLGGQSVVEASSAVTSGAGEAAGSMVNPSGVVIENGLQSMPGSQMIGSFDVGNMYGAQGSMSVSPSLNGGSPFIANLDASSPASSNGGPDQPRAGISANGNYLQGLPEPSSSVNAGVDSASMTPEQFNQATGTSGGGGAPWYQKAGLEIGKQALGSFLTGATEPSYMKDYAKTMKDVNDRNMQISDYNMSMANKKAAVGDQLYGDANAMSPDYFAEQQRRQRQTMDANAWGDAEQRMRSQGKDDSYINNERRRFDLGTSSNQGTAYDAGWQTGMASRNNTFSTAGGMYGGVGYMGDPTGGMYQTYAQANQQRATGIGRGIDAVFNADKQNQTGTENTRDKDRNMGVSNSFGGW